VRAYCKTNADTAVITFSPRIDGQQGDEYEAVIDDGSSGGVVVGN